ncbi:unnamed protein product [Nippostrongylus brasiliensis]|uniref:SCP domain-containing protein n=1 Tax=Nippostrongylus brasiliensis TaxID=27835 RepID=A0A0N4XY18_NIPBR|nr:hypothetical protein Q1695_008342 [Nippostrongylus brasiliensis]VDL71536.1 unnamed protein product [Nippostrongylus brasiliensis]
MWTTWLVAAAILLSVFPNIGALDKIDPSKCSPAMQDDLRSAALDAINNVRSTVALGDAKAAKFFVPSAPNMYKLAYNCELEDLAKKQTENGYGCEFPHTPLSDKATNYIHFYGGPGGAWQQDPLKTAITEMTKQADSADMWFQKNVYNESVANIPDYVNMIRADTTSVGCFEQLCAGGESAACCVFDQLQIKDGDEIFPSCKSCTTDDQCTTYPGSKCEAPLCVGQASSSTTSTASSTTTTKPTTTTTQPTTTTTRDPYDINCPGNVGMDVSMREKALIMLNYRRGQLAANKVEDSNGAFLPAGANLVTLKYHCDLESAAQAEADKCAASSGSSLLGTSENFYRKTATTKMNALQDGIKSWWNQVRRVGGINLSTVTFTSANQNSPIRFMTLMGWANVRSMGCGVAQCGGYYNVVCRFDPRGNIVNQAIYQKGNACSACPAGFSRCVDNLCTA